jgi:hypothetical protein
MHSEIYESATSHVECAVTAVQVKIVGYVMYNCWLHI